MALALLAPLRESGARFLDLIYPPRCFACSEETDQPHGLCPACWRDTMFISGSVCETCGVPVSGESEPFVCDACLTFPPPWAKGRSVLLYNGSGRRIVLSFKHADRTDMAKPLAAWMARSGGEVLEGCDLLVPVPLHWQRLLKRGYNQSALLCQGIGATLGLASDVSLLTRNRFTETQDGRNREERFENMRDAISLSPRSASRVEGKTIVLVDDVMTTGATLSACASVLQDAGAREVRVLVLARVDRDTR